MKKHLTMFVTLCFVVLSLQSTGAMAGENVPMCRLGINPVDTTRDVNWTSQCLLTLTTPQVVRMGSASGSISTCRLATGTSVVIDKMGGRAQYVRYCANPLVGQPFLSGQRDCAPPAPAPVERLVIQTERIEVPQPAPAVTAPRDLQAQVAPTVKKHHIWPWVLLGAVLIAAAASGGGHSSNNSVRPGPTIP